ANSCHLLQPRLSALITGRHTPLPARFPDDGCVSTHSLHHRTNPSLAALHTTLFSKNSGPSLGMTGTEHLNADEPLPARQDRKSTRLNSSHVKISYAVF